MLIASRGPVVLKEEVQVSRVVDIDGFGRQDRVHFPHEIHWIRVCEYNVALFHRGVPVKDSITLCDGSGEFLSGLDEGVLEAAGEAAFFKIPFGSDGLEVRLTVIVKDVPLLKRENTGLSNIEGLNWYDRLPRDWSRGVDGVSYSIERPDIESNHVRLLAEGWIQEKDVASVDVWSSARSVEENKASVEAFRTEYGAIAIGAA